MRNAILILLLIASPALAQRQTTVFFHAKWCGPCKASESAVRECQEDGERICWVDIDEQPDVAKAYRVKAVPCFVCVYEGPLGSVEVGRLVGQVNAAQLRCLCNFPIAATIGRNCRQLIEAAAGVPPW